MKNKLGQILVIFILTVLTGCAGLTAMLTSHGRLTSKAEDAYTRGDLDETVRKTVKALTIEPEYEKAQRLLVSSFEPAILKHKENVSSLTESKDLEELSRLVREHEILIELNRLVKNLPPLMDKKTSQPLRFLFFDYSSDLLKSKNIAAEAYYLQGQQDGSKGGINRSRVASEHFKKALGYIPRYKDAKELAKKYKKMGTKRVAIIPFLWPEDQRKYKEFGTKIIEDLKHSLISQNKNKMEYFEFVSSNQLRKILMKHNLRQQGLEIDKKTAIKIGKDFAIHELIIGNVTELTITPPATNESKKRETTTVTITRQKNITERGLGVLGGLLKGEKLKDSTAKNLKDSNTVQEDIEVAADIKVYELSAFTRLAGAYNIINLQTASDHESNGITGEYSFNHRWASFTGDKRALSENTQELLNSNANKKAPAEKVMIISAATEFSRSLTSNMNMNIFSIEGYQ